MNPLTEEIVAAYAEHGEEGVKLDPEFRELCSRHGDDTAFNREIVEVRDVAGLLERTLFDLTYRDQVEYALRALCGYKNQPEKQSICRALTRRRYAPRWSIEQLNYYESASEKLLGWRDYFLSFTNYNPISGEVLLVNNEHKSLIKLGLGRFFRMPVLAEENLLARLINYRLANAELDGYFYPSHRDQENVEERLQREARAVFSFIQLLQDTMFRKWPNYCKLEFEAASEDDARPLIFVMAGSRASFVQRHRVDSRMHDWHDAIMDRDVVELQPASTTGAAREVLDLIKQRVVEPVRNAQEQLYENVPV